MILKSIINRKLVIRKVRKLTCLEPVVTMGEHGAIGATLMLFLEFGKRPVSFRV